MGTIRGNILIMREDDAQPWPATMQAIGFFDGPLIGFRVEGNVILTSHWHGVSLYDAQGCNILRNVVYTRWKKSRSSKGELVSRITPEHSSSRAMKPQPWYSLLSLTRSTMAKLLRTHRGWSKLPATINMMSI